MMCFWWEMIRFLKGSRHEETCETVGLGGNCWHCCSRKSVLVFPKVPSKTQNRPVEGFWSKCRQVSVANGYCERGLGLLSNKSHQWWMLAWNEIYCSIICPTFLGFGRKTWTTKFTIYIMWILHTISWNEKKILIFQHRLFVVSMPGTERLWRNQLFHLLVVLWDGCRLKQWLWAGGLIQTQETH